MGRETFWTADPAELLRVGEGFRLAAVDTDGHPGFDGGKAAGRAALAEGAAVLNELQEQLFANNVVTGDPRRVLLVLQAMDSAGKGGIVNHVMGAVDPQGVHLVSFKKPTAEELEHDFLWRVHRQVPGAGKIGVFDRSHYEDVLIGRVRSLAPADEIERRYGAINDFEAELAATGTTIVKVMLHISKDEQKQRLGDRLARADKHWKFNPGDLDTRSKWPAFQEAYADVFRLTSTEDAPWYVVPADKKWYSRLAITEILTRTLEELDPQWPVADFDVEEMKKALVATGEDAPA